MPDHALLDEMDGRNTSPPKLMPPPAPTLVSPTASRPSTLTTQLSLPPPPHPTDPPPLKEAASPSSSPSPSPSPRGSALIAPLRRASLLTRQSQMQHMSVMSFRIKRMVSKEKRRFDADGFNLDLTYVTPRLIAFGYPAENLEGVYRNHYKDVLHFFDQRHDAHYRVYNLCSERSYAPDKFHGRVVAFPFDDHAPPPLALFVPFCQDVDAWLSAHPDHVAAVHCKAGKGRTGVMLCAYLLYCGVWRTASAAMQFFGAARSLKGEGVTIPSQQRFIAYFAAMCRGSSAQTASYQDDDDAHMQHERRMSTSDFHRCWADVLDGQDCVTTKALAMAIPRALPPEVPPRVHLALVGITIDGVYALRRIDPRVRVECGMHDPNSHARKQYDLSGAFIEVDHLGTPRQRTRGRSASAPLPLSQAERDADATNANANANTKTNAACITIALACARQVVWDEVRLSLRHRSGRKLGQLWFHTAFVPRTSSESDPGRFELVAAKHEIDKVVKDAKDHKKYAPHFQVRLQFELATAQDLSATQLSGMSTGEPAHSAPPSPSGRARPRNAVLQLLRTLSPHRRPAAQPASASASTERPRSQSVDAISVATCPACAPDRRVCATPSQLPASHAVGGSISSAGGRVQEPTLAPASNSATI